MQLHAVQVPVSAPVLVECIFWPEDDVWKGASQELSLSVHGSNFEETKRNMEAALQIYIQSVLHNHKTRQRKRD